MQLITVTAQYSNAVLLVILPQISQFWQRLDPTAPKSIDVSQVSGFTCSTDRDNPGGSVFLTNGYAFAFGDGIVDAFYDIDHSLRSPRGVANSRMLTGNLEMSKDDAIAFARATIRHLGYSEVDLFADGDPQFVRTPRNFGTSVLPYYDLRWPDPRSVNSLSCSIEIDGCRKKITAIELANSILWQDSPKIPLGSNSPPLRDGMPQFIKGNAQLEAQFRNQSRTRRFSAEETSILINEALVAVTKCAVDLGLSLNVSTNQIVSFDPQSGRMELTGNYDFVFDADGRYISSFRGPRAFWHGRFDGHVPDYWGKWNLSEHQAVELGRHIFRALSYWKDPSFLDASPEVRKPVEIGTHQIPRYLISWRHAAAVVKDGEPIPMDARAEIEIDADKGIIKSFFAFAR